MKKLFTFALLMVCFAVAGISKSSWAQETYAAIQGTVTDPSGAVVPDAQITASSEKLITPVTVKTDIHGFYRLNALPAGKYTLKVTAAGMSATATNFVLSPGDLPTYNIKLNISTATTIVDVTADVALVDVTVTKVETTIDSLTLQQIPTGRSFQSVIPFAPGARQEPLQSLSGNRLNGFQIDGASNGENVYASEGLNITSVIGGGVGMQVPMEFVQDVQVKSSSFEAEYGGALGGVINVIQQRGSSNWHGSFVGYYRSSALNANDQCNVAGNVFTSSYPGSQNAVSLYNTTCGQRLDPATTSSSATRSEQAAQYYLAKQDHYRTVDPGFTVGGPLLTNKVFAFVSYIPDFTRTRRTATFTKTNPGPRTFYQSQDTHFGLARLDYSPWSKLSVFGSYQYAYSRIVGVLPNPDSLTGQLNSSSTSDPTTFRADTGTVNPLSTSAFGANYTLNSKTLISARYGYFYQDTHDIGKPVGNRWAFQTSSAPGSFSTNPVPGAYSQSAGYANLGANQQFVYDQITRKQFSVDISTLKTGWWGTHEFKGGYALYRTGENVLLGYKTAYTAIYPGQSYSVHVSTACNSIIAQNQAQWPGAPNVGTSCQGDYGYFIVSDGVDNVGKISGNNDAFYGQDAWTVGHTGLTINAGVRFDKEYLPPYDPKDQVDVSFSFGQKVAPRIGVAYDVLHNGKLKVYGSYGKFFDIVKYSLPRGSFGGDYWHDCAYALDNPNYNLITPSAPDGHACPASGPAPGVPSASTITANSFRFIENMDYRAHTQDPTDPQVDPNLKPMSQHEYVVGADWAMRPTLAFSARFAHKYLDNTIEDISVNDAVYYIGNPGPGYGDPLHRPANQLVSAIPGPLAYQFNNPQGVCPSCPIQPKALRQYNGAEFRVTKNSSRGFISAFYTYSKLTGNYPGLTTTFSTDGGGGRQSPNNNRSFDLPQMQFTAHGKPFGGPLPTDRPNTFGAYGSIHQKWMLGTSTLGFGQTIYQGTPVSTCWSTISTTSSCQFVEDQGNWVKLSRDAAGNFISNGIDYGRRTPAYLQTDLNLSHYLPINKDHENRKIGAEINVYNALNQHAVTSYYETPVGNAAALGPAANNGTTFDYAKLMTGFDYVGLSNTAGLWEAARYGLPNQFQLGRQVRFKVAYTF